MIAMEIAWRSNRLLAFDEDIDPDNDDEGALNGEPDMDADFDPEDENFEDGLEDENDLHEIRVGDDLGEPDPEDDDHLPDEELQ